MEARQPLPGLPGHENQDLIGKRKALTEAGEEEAAGAKGAAEAASLWPPCFSHVCWESAQAFPEDITCGGMRSPTW